MHNLYTIALILVLTCCDGLSNKNLVNYSRPLDQLLDSLNLEPGMIYLQVDKSDFVLSVMVDTMILKQYPVVLGGNPVDDKLRQGDLCTPEGEFLVRAKYPHKSWDKFIWIDYPNDESWKKHRKAKEEGHCARA